MNAIRFASVNTGENAGDPWDRYTSLMGHLQEMPEQPDVLMFQEVTWDTGFVALEGVRELLGDEYRLFGSETYRDEDDKGSAVITRYPVRSNAALPYDRSKNHIQVVDFGDRYGSHFALANVYLEASPTKELVRIGQINELAEHLNEEFVGRPHIVGGDFNALPSFRSVRQLKKHGFESTLATVSEGHQPHTYPTPLSFEEVLDGYSKPHQFHSLRLAGLGLRAAHKLSLGRTQDRSSKSGLISYTIDGIHHRGAVRTVDAGLIYDGTSIFPPFSDHAGIWATLELQNGAA